MNHLYELLCMGAAPSVSADEFKRANFQQFMTKTLASAKYITSDEGLRQEAIARAKTLLGQKSHSTQNTVRTIKAMFNAAKGACDFNRERCMLEWLEMCVTLALQSCESDVGHGGSLAVQSCESDVGRGGSLAVPDTYDKIGASEVSDEGETAVAAKKKKKKNNNKQQARRIQSSPRRKAKKNHSDSEYHPSESGDDDEEDEDDASVPILKEVKVEDMPENRSSTAAAAKKTTKKKKKKATPKPSKEQDVAISEAIDPGAGTQAVAKYFAKMANGALKPGYFCQSYFFPSKESYNIFLSVLGSATSTLEVCVYSLTDDDTADCLIAAKKRGVNIRIITDDQQAANRYADAARLQKDHGIPYKDDNSPSYMHNKFAVIDGKVLINGSFNWSRNARFKNRENIIITNIPETINQFHDEFEKLWELF